MGFHRELSGFAADKSELRPRVSIVCERVVVVAPTFPCQLKLPAVGCPATSGCVAAGSGGCGRCLKTAGP